MTKKIFRCMLTVAVAVLLASLVTSVSFIYDYFNHSQTEQLSEELKSVAEIVNVSGKEFFENYHSSVFRFTLVSGDGEVVFDTEADAESMENHKNREEIKEALAYGKGSSARYSSTLTQKNVYEAVELENGNVLRISASHLTVGALVLGMLPTIAAIIIISLIVSLFLSDKMAKSIVKPLDRLDLENPQENDVYEELSPILRKINNQHKQIEKQMRQLRHRTDEFRQITDSMSEGLVMLNKNGEVLSINPAAQKLFGADETAVGNSFVTVDRSTEMIEAIDDALIGKHSEFRKLISGREYQFSISRIESAGKTIGVVILCFDVTETAFAERNRQEFTANVSHELKTPLQSIIGSAELLESGLVKPEDTSRFVGNIKKEATRLVSLINDIIRLSQLDENSTQMRESVDLSEVAAEVIEVLKNSAQKKNVTLELSGGECIINGIRRYLYEIIYNLCDNAIRYNVDGGKVTVDISYIDSKVVLKVSDTGIGIPPEHQSRIFERFYRVDKSHSKETGGTGLGLSIVKHAVSYHGGNISLESVVGKGTQITVTF